MGLDNIQNERPAQNAHLQARSTVSLVFVWQEFSTHQANMQNKIEDAGERGGGRGGPSPTPPLLLLFLGSPPEIQELSVAVLQ